MPFRLAVLALVLALASGDAEAYPQYQLSYAQTCTACHLSPSGGGLLGENGLAVAESKSWLGHKPELMYGLFAPPAWLVLGGDARSATGFIATPEKALAFFPMQYEVYARATRGSVSVHVTAGLRPTQDGNELLTRAWSREHYVQWQQRPGESEGLYARVGRFMPVFGLRVAEHPTYLRRYGGTPLFADTYGASVSWIDERFEAHVSGFVEDPLIDPVVHGNGGAVYAEARLSEQLALGAEGMIRDGDASTAYHVGATAKYWLPAANLLLQGELQYAPLAIDVTPGNPAGGNPRGIVGGLIGSVMLPRGFMVDVGLGHFDPNYQVKDLDRDYLDLNLHWFVDSHLEVVLDTRYELLAFGRGGRSGGYAVVQLHYRL